MFKRIIPTAIGLGLAATLGFGVASAASAAVQDSYTYYGYTFVVSDLVNGKPRVPAELRGQEISMWNQAWNQAKSAYERDRNSSPATAPTTPTTTPTTPTTTPTTPAPAPTQTAKTYTYNGFTFTEADLKYGKPAVPAQLRGQQISMWHQAWNQAKSAYEQDQNRR